MKNIKNKLTVLFSFLTVLALTFGIVSFSGRTVSAEEEKAFAIEMLDGARIKVLDEKVYLVFEATALNTDLVEDVTYGFTVTEKDQVGVDGAETWDIPATVVDENTAWMTATVRALFDVGEDYTTSYYAVAYAKVGEETVYAESNLADNARSASYVAQMAINYDGASEERIAELEPIAGDNDFYESIFSSTQDRNDMTVEGGTKINEGENFVLEASLGRFSWDAGFDRGMVTKTSYEAITEISFNAMIPSAARVSWWGVTILSDKGLKNGDAAYIGAATMANLGHQIVLRDTWYTVKYVSVDGMNWDVFVDVLGESMTEEDKKYTFTIPETELANYKDENGKSYVAVIGEYGRTNVNQYVQLDDFKVIADYGEEYTDGFDGGESSLFDFGKSQLGGTPARIVYGGKAGIEMNEEFVEIPEGEGHAIISFTSFSAGYRSFTTKQAYKNITEMKVDIYIPNTNEVNHWWGFAPVASIAGDAYTGSDATAGEQNVNKLLVQNYGWTDKWITLTYKVEGTVWTMSISRVGVEESHEAKVFDFKASDYSANGASYIYLCANPGQSQNWGIWMDNFTIVADGVTYVDDFNKGKSELFVENVKCATYHYEGPSTGEEEVPEGTGYAVIDFKKISEGRMSFYSTNAYKNISRFSVDVYIPKANENMVWYGFTPSAKQNGTDANGNGGGYYNACTGGLNLNGVNIHNNYGWTDMWVTLNYTVENGIWKLSITRTGHEDGVTKDSWSLDATGADYSANGESYILLSACPAQPFEWGIWMDNIVIEADGKTYTDNFNKGKSELFTFDANAVSISYTPAEGYEPPVEKTFEESLLDGTADEYIYDTTFTSSVKVGEYGDLTKVDADSLAVMLDVSYKMGTSGEYIILLSRDETTETANFLYVTDEKILLFANDRVEGEIAINKQYAHDIRIAVLGNGTVIVSVDNQDFTAIGETDKCGYIAIGGLNCVESIIFTEISVKDYTSDKE